MYTKASARVSLLSHPHPYPPTVIELFLASAGANLVDLFPSLDLLPDILAPWHPAALEQRALTQRVYKGLLSDVWNKLTHDGLAAEDAFAARSWQDRKHFAIDELDVAYLAGTL